MGRTSQEKQSFADSQRRFLRSLGRRGWRSVTLDELARKSTVGFRSCAARSVLQNRFSKAWCLAQAHASRNHRLINALAKVLAHLGHNLLTQICSAIVHGHDNTAQFEALVRA